MKRVARLALLAGALGVGWFLLGARPRDVDLVYDVSALAGPARLDVEIRHAGELVRRAELRVEPRAQVHHRVRLRDGTYRLAWRLVPASGATGSAAPAGGERDLVVSGDETIVLPLGG